MSQVPLWVSGVAFDGQQGQEQSYQFSKRKDGSVNFSPSFVSSQKRIGKNLGNSREKAGSISATVQTERWRDQHPSLHWIWGTHIPLDCGAPRSLGEALQCSESLLQQTWILSYGDSNPDPFSLVKKKTLKFWGWRKTEASSVMLCGLLLRHIWFCGHRKVTYFPETTGIRFPFQQEINVT